MKNRKLVLMVMGLLFGPLTANATFVFSDAQITSNSVTFTIDGDMTGYGSAPPSLYTESFSIIYSGDLWVGPALFDPPTSYSPNTWSGSIFDNEQILLGGNTGTAAPLNFYTWSMYSNTLSDAYASNRTVTVSFSDYLNPLATNGAMTFVWGNGSNSNLHTVLGSVSVWNQSSSVPEPGMLGLMIMGLASLGLARRHSRALRFNYAGA